MNNLIDIYINYELGDIYPENLPAVACELLTYYSNNYLVELASLNNPTKYEIDKILLKAFGISDEKKINSYEKIELLINRYSILK